MLTSFTATAGVLPVPSQQWRSQEKRLGMAKILKNDWGWLKLW